MSSKTNTHTNSPVDVPLFKRVWNGRGLKISS
jgi:hypothetical protein